MRLTLGRIAELTGGRVRGDAQRVITGVSSLSSAGPGDISFVRDAKAMADAASTKAGALLVREAAAEFKCDLVIVPNPALAFAKLASIAAEERFRRSPGIDATALVAGSAQIGRDCSIGPGCVIEDGARIGERTTLYAGVFIGRGCAIGDECLVYPNVTIREETTIGNRCIIHSNTCLLYTSPSPRDS